MNDAVIPNGPQTAQHVLPAIGTLVLVLALILALAWIARRWLRAPGLSRSNFSVLGAMSIGPREKLLLVDVGGKQVLLGVTPGSITSLQPLAEPIELPQVNELTRGAPGESPFAALLAKATARTQTSRTGA